jgi:tRNA nucleotidyltransferase (CCA-adding enzyme)
MEIKKILSEQLELIKPSEEESKKIQLVAKNFIQEIKANIKKKNFKAEVFVGGSLAKDTLVKKDIYDVDIFIRFDSKYGDDKISELLGKVIGKNASRIHGSRDYYQLNDDGILIEAIPVIKINKPEDAENVTDLSYFHVNYITEKIKKDKKLIDEIRLAKSFAHAQYCYGAESYIHGFSGYALELLICHFGSFLKFIKTITDLDPKKGKLIIDDAKFYKNKDQLMIELNSSKSVGPLILIDPTFKERNAGSSLNEETLYKFQNACRGFLKKPSLEFFKKKAVETDFKKFKDVKVIEIKTDKQAGDISGTKSKKFFDFMIYKMKKEFIISKTGFDYNEDKNITLYYFVVKKKKDEIRQGPPITSVSNLTGFKKAHPEAFIKKGYAYACVKHCLDFDRWFKKFLKDEKKIITSMNVVEVKKI